MTEIPVINLALYAQTDVGMVRSGNEDNFLILDLSTGRSWTASDEEPADLLTYTQGYYGSLLAVSDGMGGALAGEVASRMAVETVRDRMLQLQAHEVYGRLPLPERLRLAIEQANLLIHREGRTNPEHKGLGATFTAVAIQGGELYFAQVGDSRAYLIRQGRIIRVTKDQSLVQQLIDAGQITEEEAETHSYRNVILQALGAHQQVNVEVSGLSLRQLDTLLLCSDGLSGKIHEDEIARIVAAAPDLKSACEELVSLANERGGEDNITVVIAQFSGSGIAPPEREAVEPRMIPRSPSTPETIDWRPVERRESVTSGSSLSPPHADSVSEIEPADPSSITPSSSSNSRTQRESPPETRPSGDLAGRRGPITAVFASEDYAENEQTEAVTKQRAAATKLPDPTARQTKPLSAVAGREREQGSASKAAAALVEEYNFRRPRARPSLRAAFGLTLLGSLLLLGLAAGGFWYYRHTLTQAETQRQQKEQQQTLAVRIGELRNRIALLNRRASQLPAQQQVETLRQRLEEVARRLDGISTFPPDKFPEAMQACQEVDEVLEQIDSNLKKIENITGLLLSPLTQQQPASC
jgi:protein phosphatase